MNSSERTKVVKLAQRVERRHEEREQDKLAKEFFRMRENLVVTLPKSITTEFWCSACQKDFNRQALKVTQSWTGVVTAFFQTKCECGRYCRRQITDKTSDPYYRQSKLLRMSTLKMEIDLLQPSDPRFKLYYGDPYQKYNDNLEIQEREAYERRKGNRPR